MALSELFLFVLAVFTPNASAYLDHGDATLPKEVVYTPTIPHHLQPTDQVAHVAGHVMITAIAPSISLLPHGVFETYYSMHFQNQVPRKKIGKGIFERGVFASDPPFPTCDVCDANGNHISTRTSVSGTASSGAPSCTTIPYGGVFRSPDPARTTYCFDRSYTGVFSTSVPYTYVLPCCPSCAPNSTSSSSSYSITTGVLVTTTTFTSNGTASTFSATPSSIPSSSRVSSSSSRPSSSLSRPNSSSTTSSSRNLSLGPTLASPSTSVGASTRSSSSPSSSSTPSNTSVIVISSTTITIRPSTPGMSSSINTITVITASPSTSTSKASSSVDLLAPDTIIGCGTAVSGCGTVVGTGTVFLDALGLMRVTSIGTAIGCAPKVIGCGTMLATTGTFTGSATIYGCGTASGTATMTGAGTVWPAIGGGLFSIVSSGVITGSGSVVGCGTIIGSGVFTATAPFSVSVPATSTPTKTVEVYVSYCPTNMPGYGMPRIGDNFTSAVNGTGAPYPLLNNTLLNTTFPMLNATNYTAPTNDVIPACKQCPNTALCCAPDAVCDGQGKCPQWAIEAMGYWRFDLNQVTQRNKSDGTQGPIVTDEELRMMDGVGSMELGKGSGETIADGLLGGMTGGKVDTGVGIVGDETGSGRYGMGNMTHLGQGNGTSERNSTKGRFNGFVVKDDNVFFSH